MGSAASAKSSQCASERDLRPPTRERTRHGRAPPVIPEPVRDIDVRLYKELGTHAASTLLYPQTRSKDNLELNQVRKQVMSMAGNVNVLTTESDTMRDRIAQMKKRLRNVDFGLGVCRRAQEESARKMLEKRLNVKKKRVQVNYKDPEFSPGLNKETQTLGVNELMIMYMTSAITEPDGCEEFANAFDDDNLNAEDAALGIELMRSLVSVAGPQRRKRKNAWKILLCLALKFKKQRKGLPGPPWDKKSISSSMSEESVKPDPMRYKWLKAVRARERFGKHVYRHQRGNRSVIVAAFVAIFSSMVMLALIIYHLLVFPIPGLFDKAKELRIKAYQVGGVAVPNITCQKQRLKPPQYGSIKCPDGQCSDAGRCRFGTQCLFKCDDWHRMSTSKSVATCTLSGDWKAKTPKCKFTKCIEVKDRDCANLFRNGLAPQKDGVYQIVNCRTFQSYDVFCDASTMGGGWTAIQERITGVTNFQRTVEEFENYFGKPVEDYWIGLENLLYITSNRKQSLLVQMTDWRYPDDRRFDVIAMYTDFKVYGAKTGYRLKVSGYQEKVPYKKIDAGDSMVSSDGMQFTTKDSDKDRNLMYNCATLTGGAWWHANCTDVNFNAEFVDKPKYGIKAMYWNTWRVQASVKEVRMLMREKDWE